MKTIKIVFAVILVFLATSCQTISANESNNVSTITDPKSNTSTELLQTAFVDDRANQENSFLFFGNPSNSTPELENENNYLLYKDHFVMSYNNSTMTANWVAWHLDSNDLGDISRNDNFHADISLPESWNAVGTFQLSTLDYQYKIYGFDRGHLCPSADRTSSLEANNETFVMTNMIPQAPNNNQQTWKNIEAYERKLVLEGNELYIYAGPYGIGGISNKGYFDYIILDEAKNVKIKVPAHVFKIILYMKDGENDLARVENGEANVVAFIVPNNQSCNKKSWEEYKVSVDYLEQLLCFDFFDKLPDEIEESIEAGF